MRLQDFRYFCVQALAREQERTLVENKDQQAAEADKLMQDLDKKEHEDMDGLERKLKEEKEKVLREASAKHEAEARARTDLSEEQIQQVIKHSINYYKSKAQSSLQLSFIF